MCSSELLVEFHTNISGHIYKQTHTHAENSFARFSKTESIFMNVLTVTHTHTRLPNGRKRAAER